MKVKEKLSSVSSALERKDFFVSTIMCGISSLLTQVTFVPGVTVICSGSNVKLPTVIVTLCSPAWAGLAARRKAATPSPANPRRDDPSTRRRPAGGAVRSASSFLNFQVIDMKSFLFEEYRLRPKPRPAASADQRLSASADQRLIDDGQRVSAANEIDGGDAEIFAEVTGSHLHRPRRRSGAGGRLREGGRARGVERDIAFHLLHDLMDVPVEHRHRAEPLQV